VIDFCTGHGLRSEQPTFATDRYGEKRGAIGVRDMHTFWSLPPAVYFTGTPLTIMAWIRVHTCTNWDRLLDCGNNSQNDNVLLVLSYYGDSCSPRFDVYSGSSPTHTGLHNFKFGYTWAHVAATVSEERRAVVYVNGAVVSTSSSAHLFNSPRNVTRTKCFLGKSNWNVDAYANADFDEIKFYNRALSREDVDFDFRNVRSFVYKV
jgi:hypothetical protein